MALKYYLNYIDNLAMSPNTEYRSGMQALVDAQWDNTTTKYTIQEEANMELLSILILKCILIM